MTIEILSSHFGWCLACGRRAEAGAVIAWDGLRKVAQVNYRECAPSCESHTRTQKQALDRLLSDLGLAPDTPIQYREA